MTTTPPKKKLSTSYPHSQNLTNQQKTRLINHQNKIDNLTPSTSENTPLLATLTDWPQSTRDKVRAEYSKPINPRITPPIVLTYLELYESVPDGMHRCADKIGIGNDWLNLWAVLQCDPSAATRLAEARRRKLHIHLDAAANELSTLPEDRRYYQADREGEPTLTGAASSLMHARAQMRLRLAQVAEAGTTVPQSRSEVTTRSLAVSIDYQADSPRDMVTALTDLLGAD